MAVIRWRRAAILLAAAILTTGCVSTRVSSRVASQAKPVERVAVVVRSGQFNGGNTASQLGQRNLDALLPFLSARLPAVLTAGGLPARGVGVETTAPRPTLRLEPGEQLMVVTPVSAEYSSRSGQTLNVRAEVVDPLKRQATWRGDIRLHTLGFGKFDEGVANDVASKVLERLRSDGLLPGATPRAEAS